MVDGAPVRALYRRTDEDRVRDEDGQLTYSRSCCWSRRAPDDRLVNWFGKGANKRVYPYVDDLVRLYLGEEPHLKSVPTYDLVDERRVPRCSTASASSSSSRATGTAGRA